jgi:hypothetical protein
MIRFPRREAIPRHNNAEIPPEESLQATFLTCTILGHVLAEIQGMVFIAIRHFGVSGNRHLADLAVELVQMQHRLESIVGRLPAALRADDDG